jgi:hypothetical protein
MSLSKDPRSALRAWLLGGPVPGPQETDDAAGLVEAALEQGLAGLLHEATSGADWLPAQRDRLAALHRAVLVRGVAQRDQARRVDAALARRGLRGLPLKGAAVAERWYATVGERPMADVDVLALDGWDASVAALLQDGFRENGRGDHAWSFTDPVTGGVLELHHAYTSCDGLFPVDREGLWARSRLYPGQVPRLPSTEDLLVHLALHAAFQHGLVLSLVQYLDFRRLLERDPPDPDRLHELAARARADVALGWALRAAEAVVGAPVPERLKALFPLGPAGRPGLLRRLAAPLSLVNPTSPDLVWARWALAAGRRVELVRRTLAGDRRGGARLLRAPARALTLAGRFVLPSLHARLADARSRAG